MAANASKSVFAWVTMTCTSAKVRPASSQSPPFRGCDPDGKRDDDELAKNDVPWRPGVYGFAPKDVLENCALSSPRSRWLSSRLRLPRARRTRRISSGPDDGQTVSFLPVFSWDPVAGPTSTTSSSRRTRLFNSPVYRSTGRRTRARLPTRPCRTARTGGACRRSTRTATRPPGRTPRSIEKLWADSPDAHLPRRRRDDLFPRRAPGPPLGPGPRRREVQRLRSPPIPDLSLARDSRRRPVEIQATNAAPGAPSPLEHVLLGGHSPRREGQPGRAVRDPLLHLGMAVDDDSRRSRTSPGNRALRSEVHLGSDPRCGALRSRGQLGLRLPERDSKVCCTADKPITTTFTPKETLPEQHVLLARPRAQRARRAGDWNEGPSFDKTFDNYPAPRRGRDQEPAHAGHAPTREPSRWRNARLPDRPADRHLGSRCRGPRATRSTSSPTTPARRTLRRRALSRAPAGSSTTATHLVDAAGLGRLSEPAVPVGPGASKDSSGLNPGRAYCVQVHARSGRVNLSSADLGRFRRHLDDGTGASFTFTDYPTGGACSPTCNANYLGHDDYLLRFAARPIRRPTRSSCGTRSRASSRTGSSSPRIRRSRTSSTTSSRGSRPTRCGPAARRRTYPDETTSYYWVVLPATGHDGSGAPGTFRRERRLRRLREAIDAPTLARSRTTPRRSPVLRPSSGRRRPARRSTTSRSRPNPPSPRTPSWTTSRPRRPSTPPRRRTAAKTLYWRVQAQDENNNGLTWSETRTFEIDLDAAHARPGHADARRREPACSSLVPGSGRRLLQPSDPRAERHDAEHLLRASRPRRPPSRRSPARASSRGRSAPTSRRQRRHDPGPVVGRRRLHAHDQGAHESGVERGREPARPELGREDRHEAVPGAGLQARGLQPVLRDEDDGQSRLGARA